jgi:hypothetical protein
MGIPCDNNKLKKWSRIEVNNQILPNFVSIFYLNLIYSNFVKFCQV